MRRRLSPAAALPIVYRELVYPRDAGDTRDKERTMDWKTLVIEFLLAGFFAVACFRAQTEPPAGRDRTWTDFFKLSGRIERLRRSRWQWFSLVGFMLVLRLQQQLPLILELMVAIEFTLFMALPKSQRGIVKAHTR
jgi:hypothetical protein